MPRTDPTVRPTLVAGVVSIGLALGAGGLVTHGAQDEAPDGVVNYTRIDTTVAGAGVPSVHTQARHPLQKEVAENEVDLRDVLPQADIFRFLNDPAPHFRGYTHSTGDEDGTLVGFAFFTSDLVGGVLGYKGRIRMLVGMDIVGTLTNVRVLSHSEPFGYFSIDPPAFAEQFRGASILDPLKPGEDIDAVSQATITVDAATRAIRLSARLVAREFLADSLTKE